MPRGSRLYYGWVVVGAVGFVMLAASGVRSAFGVFIKPMEAEFGWDRTALSLVASLAFVFNGAIAPFAGRLADRWGSRGVLAVAGVLLGVGALGAATIVSIWQLYVTVGVLVAVGAGAAATSVSAPLAARWFEARRGLVFGIFGGSVAAGQLVIVPLAMWLTVVWNWRVALVALGAGFLALVLPVILTLIRNDPQEQGLRPYGAAEGPTRSSGPAGTGERTSLREAASTAPFWLLMGSFWVCGYTSSGLVLTHLIPHAAEHGFHATQAAQALGVMGAFNILGTIASGWLCDRVGQKGPLASYYFLRGVSLLFLPFVGTVPGLFAFAVFFGLNYISTVPPTTSLTARIYGRYSVGELSGWIFFSHQIGSAVGSFMGGYLYDMFGGYSAAFNSAALVAFAGAAMALAIRVEPASRWPTRAPAVPSAAGS